MQLEEYLERDDRIVRRPVPTARRGDAPGLGGGRRRRPRAPGGGLALRRVWLAGVLVLGTGAAGAAPQYFELDRIPTQHKIVALTFDGGGDTATGTPLILSTLRRRHVTATFFVSGRWIRLHRALAREIGRRYPVGNHTY